jgi:histidine triad (HIT) family protein
VPTIFTRIIRGELPGTFVWRDDDTVAFLSINPVQPGHTLVVPRAEVDHWVDLDPTLMQHLTTVAQTIGRAQANVYQPLKVGLLVAGLEVPHVHLHVIPITRGETDLHLDRATQASADQLAAEADRIRAELRALGAAGVSD